VNGRWLHIVGVASGAKYHTLQEPRLPFFYVPLRQHFSPAAALQIRTTQRSSTIEPALVREIQALDANVAPSAVITMREQIDRTTGPQRMAATMLLVFGGLALVLAAIGLYGVMASSVSQGGRELALRLTLGAERADLLRLVLARGMWLTLAGIALGTTAALQATRLLGSLLYGVSPRDPAAFVSAIGVILVASSVACVVPAWRATRTDPLCALKG
jgi:ABC-type antimicrobial peptide transport system permease subunit